MEKNPFTLMYGITARSVVSRDEEVERVVKSFVYDGNMYAYLITGIRGSGKTVLLKTIEERIKQTENWIVLNINPQSDITISLANRLFDETLIRKELRKWSLSLHLGVLTLSREGGESTQDPEIIVEDLLEKASSRLDLRVLVSIDEVNDTPEFRRFINLFQILIGKRLPIYLLMTALKENVTGLINDKAMTFLSRSPRIELEPLSLPGIAKEYQDALSVDAKTSIEMAKLTGGYAFAFQVLGYLFYERKETSLSESLIAAYDKYLWNNGYNKFWKDLTSAERAFLIALEESPSRSKAEILSHYTKPRNGYSVYRERLIEKGLLYSPSYGTLEFVLPRFGEFVHIVKEFE